MAAGTDPRRRERWVRPGRARPGEGRGRVDRAHPRPDAPVDLGPPRRRRAGARRRLPRRPSSATTATRATTGCGSASSCRRSCGRSADRGRPRTSRRTSPCTTRSRAPTAGSPTAIERSYDHYVGWALHLYPVLWARMQGARRARRGRPGTSPRLDRFLQDAVRLVGADGSPLIQGRSLIYRFAAAAPFWVGAIAGVPAVARAAAPGRGEHRHATSSQHGAPDEDGLLTMGWHGPWRPLAQSYSGPGSPYWAVKGMLGLALPADHPVWTAAEEPLPVEVGGRPRAVAAPGWIVAGRTTTASSASSTTAPTTRSRARSSATRRSTPASATRPRPRRCSTTRRWAEPLDQSVVLVDADGRSTHRAGMTLLDVRGPTTAVGIAASPQRRALGRRSTRRSRRHGSGLDGDVRRRRHGSPSCPSCAARGRCGPCASTTPTRVSRSASAAGPWPASRPVLAHGVRSDGLTSLLVADGLDTEVRLDKDASPLGTWTATPWVSTPVVAGSWWVTAVCLAQHRERPPDRCRHRAAADRHLARRPRDHDRHAAPTSSSTRATAPGVIDDPKRRAP